VNTGGIATLGSSGHDFIGPKISEIIGSMNLSISVFADLLVRQK
jgi:hypothetical protein